MREFKELKELLSFVFTTADIAVGIAEDGGFNVISDIGKLIPLAASAGEAFEGVGDIPMELSGLTADEVSYICEWAQAEFDIENDKIEGIMEEAFKAAMHLVAAISMIKKK